MIPSSAEPESSRRPRHEYEPTRLTPIQSGPDQESNTHPQSTPFQEQKQHYNQQWIYRH